MKSYLPFLGRFGITLIFIVNGLHKALEFEESQLLLEVKGIPMTSFSLIMAIIIEAFGGFMILIGYKTKQIALIMVFYLIITTAIFHPIWEELTYYVDFVKNAAIIGGLLTLAYHGAGPKSFDSHDLWS